MSAIRHRSEAAKVESFADMELPEEDGPNELIGRDRYLGRGDSCLIVSSSGMGKSSLSMIWAAHLALGRDFLGIATISAPIGRSERCLAQLSASPLWALRTRPLRVLRLVVASNDARRRCLATRPENAPRPSCHAS